LTTAELLGCGLTHKAIRTRSRRGYLHRLHRGVWAVGHPNPPTEGRLLAAVKACGRAAVLSHRAAAWLWGFLESFDGRPEVTIVGTGTRVRSGILVHRTSELGPSDVTRFNGISVTTPARTILDLAAVIEGGPLREAVRRAQGMRRVNHRQLAEICRRFGPRRGSRRLALIVATGPAPTRSVLESVVLDLILAGGLAHPEVNVPLVLGGRRVIPDFRWPAQRLVLEADGATWHDTPVARAEDAERQALLEAHGERVVRATWEQAVNRPAQTLARLRAAGVPPRPEPAPHATERRATARGGT
jgi:hypothetical protein